MPPLRTIQEHLLARSSRRRRVVPCCNGRQRLGSLLELVRMVKRRIIFLGVVLVAASGLAWFRADLWLPRLGEPANSVPANPVIPVIAGEVAQRDVPIFLSGLGS